MDRDPFAVVQAYWERLWHDGELGYVEALVGDPYVRHTANGSVTRHHAQVREDLSRYHRALYRPSVTIEDHAVSGNTVWSRVTLRGVNVDTEAAVVLSFLHVARVVDGRIVEAWNLNAPVDWDAAPRSA